MTVSLHYQIVSPLPDPGCHDHIHGRLDFRIQDRAVPYMGYFGPEDVCFNTWFTELSGVILAYRRGEKTYRFDEGEQGQPAYEFNFEGDSCFLSVVDSPLSGQEGDPAWQLAGFTMSDLVAAYEGIKTEFLAEIQREAPQTAAFWQTKLSA